MKKNLNNISVFSFIIVLTLNAFGQPEEKVKLVRTVVVRDNNFNDAGWEKDHINFINGINQRTPDTKYISITQEPGRNGSDFEFADNGSAFLTRPVSQDPTLANVRMRNNFFGGLMLSAISELKYSTYVSKCKNPANPVGPVLILQVDLNGNNIYDKDIDCSINFLPQLQTKLNQNATLIPSPLEMNKWHEWDALNGKWRFAPDTKNIPEFGKDGSLFTLATFWNFYKPTDVKILNSDSNDIPNGGPGIRFTIPGRQGINNDYDDFEGYVDGFTLSTNGGISRTYDFEYTYTGYNYKKPILIATIILILGIALFFYFKRTGQKTITK